MHRTKNNGRVRNLLAISSVFVWIVVASALAVSGVLAPMPLQAQTVTTTVPTGSNPLAEAVNPVTNKIYIPNANDGTVTVIDGATNLTSTISVGNPGGWPDAIAINAATNRIYVASWYQSIVSVIDGAKNSVIATIPVGQNPMAVIANPVTNKIYVLNHSDQTVTVIDGATNATSGPIQVGSDPQEMAVNLSTNKIYVTNYVSNNITVIDGNSGTFQTNIAVTTGTGPASLAVNPVTNKIYVGVFVTGPNVMVIDGVTNNVVATVPLDAPWQLAVNTLTNEIYVANAGNNSVAVINGATSTITTSIGAGSSPQSVAVNEQSNKIYVANLLSNTVTVIDGASNTQVATLNAGTKPWVIGVNPATDKIYAVNNEDNSVTVIDGAVNSATTVPTASYPWSVAVNPASNKIYVSNQSSNSVTVIDGVTLTTDTTLGAGTEPYAIAVNPVTNKIYVANQGGEVMVVIDGATNGTSTYTTGPGLTQGSIAVNPVTNKIYLADFFNNKVTVIDGATNGTFFIAAGTEPSAVAVNPTTNRVYVTNYFSANVTVIDGSTYSVIATVPVGASPISIAVNPVTNLIYVANVGTNPGTGTISVIDGRNNTVVTTLPAWNPAFVAVNPVSNTIYVANWSGNDLTVINGATNTVTATLFLGATPNGIAVNPVTNTIYVPNSTSNTITVIDGATNTTTNLIAGNFPEGVAVNLANNEVYVPNSQDNTLGVISPTLLQSIPLTSQLQGTPDAQTIPGMAIFATSNVSPSFTGSARTTYSPNTPPPTALYYQLDTEQGVWQQASATSSAGSNPAMYGFALNNIPWGVHTIYAYAVYGAEGTTLSAYSGFSGISPEIGNLTAYPFVVMPQPTTLTLNADVNPQSAGSDVTFTALVQPENVPGTPTGVVTFFDGPTEIAQVALPANGQVVYTTPALSVGAHGILALYSGDSNFNTSMAMVGETINVAPTPTLNSITISPTNALIHTGNGQQFLATGHYSDGSTQSLTNSVTWASSSTPIATINNNGLATGVAVGGTSITASLSGISSPSVALGVFQANAPAPMFSPTSGGTYYLPTGVSISDSTAGVTIYYTTDGSIPTINSPNTYSNPITVSTTTTIKAIAGGNGYGPSSVTVATYTIAGLAPTFSPNGGTYTSPVTVTVADTTSNAAVYYTTDGSLPTLASTSCTSPCSVRIAATTTLRAIAAGNGISPSSTTAAVYTIAALNPTFSPAAGSYYVPPMVTISSATAGATIYYTTNGAFPAIPPNAATTACPNPCLLPAAIAVSSTIRAVAGGAGFSTSNTTSAAYTIVANAPSFSLPSGTYKGTQNVTLSDATSGATIYYTTNGAIPTTTNATACTSPCTVTVSATTVMRAMATGPGISQSNVVFASYTIQ